MKLVILTTQTIHHTYFVRELSKSFSIKTVLIEKDILAAPFETYHPFEKTRNEYEKEVFFNGKNIYLNDVAETLVVPTVNHRNALRYLAQVQPQVVIVFGTGRLSQSTIHACSSNIINLHGGNPEQYRGLDSHLWAIYHNNYKNFITTLHHVNKKLDDGDIILQGHIPIKKGMHLYELRRYNTELCLRLSQSALDMYTRYEKFISRPQYKQGRYYSFMPSVFKGICVNRFKKHTEGIT